MQRPLLKMPFLSKNRSDRALFTLNVLEQFGLIFWLGTTYAISLLALPKAFSALPAEQAGLFAQAIFPAMNLFTGCALGLVLLCHFFRAAHPPPTKAGRRKSFMLLLCAALLGLNALILQPQVHALRSQRQDPIKNRAFRTLHGVSMLGNLVIMLLGIPIVVLTTSQRFQRKDAST